MANLKIENDDLYKDEKTELDEYKELIQKLGYAHFDD